MSQASRLPLPVLITAAVFGAALLLVIAAALVPRHVSTFTPREASTAPPGVEDTVTIDARDPDHWRYFAFGRGVLPSPDTAGWDLRIRRFEIVTSGTVTPAFAHWYRYDFFAHLLRPPPAGTVYVVHTRSGRSANLEILSYYCPGPEAGCLTFRYVVTR